MSSALAILTTLCLGIQWTQQGMVMVRFHPATSPVTNSIDPAHVSCRSRMERFVANGPEPFVWHTWAQYWPLAAHINSNSLPGRIQCTEAAALLLGRQAPHIKVTYRGKVRNRRWPALSVWKPFILTRNSCPKIPIKGKGKSLFRFCWWWNEAFLTRFLVAKSEQEQWKLFGWEAMQRKTLKLGLPTQEKIYN